MGFVAAGFVDFPIDFADFVDFIGFGFGFNSGFVDSINSIDFIN